MSTTKRGRKGSRSSKPPRAREYAGPNTLEDVMRFLETNALQKAKVQAIKTLSDEDSLELKKRVIKRLKDAIELNRKVMDASGNAEASKCQRNKRATS